MIVLMFIMLFGAGILDGDQEYLVEVELVVDGLIHSLAIRISGALVDIGQVLALVGLLMLQRLQLQEWRTVDLL